MLSEALRAGCSGYLSKVENLDYLPSAVRSAFHGTAAISPQMLVKLAQQRLQGEHGGADSLTMREREVLRHMGDGLTAEAIADRLGVGTTTVRTHIQNILEKLHAHSRLEAVANARRAGLLAAPDQF